MDRARALVVLNLTEEAAARPGRIERRLALLRESLGESNPDRLDEIEDAADVLLHPEGKPGVLARTWSWVLWFKGLGWRKLFLLTLLATALGLRYVLPWLSPDAALERVPPMLRELTALAREGKLDRIESRSGRILTLGERSVAALGAAPGERGERLRTRWRVDLDELTGALLELAFQEGRHGRKDETRRVLALYRRVHELGADARRVEAVP